MADAQPIGRIPGIAGFYPWGRYWAKIIDLVLAQIFIGLAFGRLMQANPQGISWLLTAALFPLMEGASIALIGTTPGKATFRISVLDVDGRKVRLGPSISRSYDAWLTGAYLGIPLISLWAFLQSYNQLKRDGFMDWDARRGIRSISSQPTWLSWLGLALMFAVYMAIIWYSGVRRPS